MKKLFLATVVLAAIAIAISSAQAITISKASVKNGVANVTGSGATPNSSISWEGVGNVATANRKGAFRFSGIVPADCVGKLSDGVTSIDVALAQCTPIGAVLETGQASCYDAAGNVIPCSGTGQDGEHRKGRTRTYTVDVNGLTITDDATGLEWEKLTDSGLGTNVHHRFNAYTWAGAFQKIADLNEENFAGHSDWCLPNVNELQTLVDYGRASPAINPVFNNGVDSFTQSSSTGRLLRTRTSWTTRGSWISAWVMFSRSSRRWPSECAQFVAARD